MLLMLFSRLILRLLPLAAVLCVIVPAMGGRPLGMDEAWEQFGFTVCELPCFAGITPGRTAFQQTPSLLLENIPIIQNRLFNAGMVVHFWASIPAHELAGSTRHTSGVVDEIDLNSTVPLDHLIAELGMPDCVVLGSSETPPRVTVMVWVRRQIAIGAALRSAEDILNLSARVRAVWIHTTYSTNTSECEQRDAVPWRGFAPLWAYYD